MEEGRVSFIYADALVRGMTSTYTVIVEQGEDGYLISEVLGLPGCHTQAKSHDELMKRTREAIKVYIKEKGSEEPVLKFVGIQQIEVES